MYKITYYIVDNEGFEYSGDFQTIIKNVKTITDKIKARHPKISLPFKSHEVDVENVTIAKTTVDFGKEYVEVFLNGETVKELDLPRSLMEHFEIVDFINGQIPNWDSYNVKKK